MQGFAALADPTRRRIVETLAHGPLSSGEIAAKFEISAPAISQHLKRLEAVKLVKVRADKQRRIYELDRTGVDELATWLHDLRGFWASRFDALESALRKEQQPPRSHPAPEEAP